VHSEPPTFYVRRAPTSAAERPRHQPAQVRRGRWRASTDSAQPPRDNHQCGGERAMDGAVAADGDTYAPREEEGFAPEAFRVCAPPLFGPSPRDSTPGRCSSLMPALCILWPVRFPKASPKADSSMHDKAESFAIAARVARFSPRQPRGFSAPGARSLTRRGGVVRAEPNGDARQQRPG
jgi:hypothetical protein